MTSFDSIKNMRNNRNQMLASVQAQAEKLASKNTRKVDERFWKPTLDKAGNGSAVIRFLPPAKGEVAFFVKIFYHHFQGPGGWFVENSLTTLNQKDPVSEYNSELWNSGIDANKDIARAQKRKLKFISNIMVVKDSANPENEGKVFLFEYGKKIFDKIQDVINPKEEVFDPETNEMRLKEPGNPFCFWTGQNFHLKVRKVEGYTNYDKSEFLPPTEVLSQGTDEQYESLWSSFHSLEEFIAAKNFKTYSELKDKLDRVLKSPDGSVARRAEEVPSQTVQESFSATEDEEEDDDSGDEDDFMAKLKALEAAS